jgi:hypothetical protein
MSTVDQQESGTAATPIDLPLPPPYTKLANSTYMDFTSWRSNASEGPTGDTPVTGPDNIVAVALVLDRANDPTALLQKDWAERQQELKTLNDNGTLWSTYGADPTKYANVVAALEDLGIETVGGDPSTQPYVSTAESRTIWVRVTADQFKTLFGPGAELLHNSEGGLYWKGDLSLPTEIKENGVSGLWFDTNAFNGTVVAFPGSGTPPPLQQGHQSEGNASTAPDNLFPQQIGKSIYNMPLGGDVATGTIGLIEPIIGTAMPGDNTGTGFQNALDTYRGTAGVPTGAPATNVANGGQVYSTSEDTERSLDVGIVATVAPQSPLVLYAGSGSQASNPYTGWQSAFWDTINNPEIVTASVGLVTQVAPNSPFLKAINELFVDAALNNITTFNAVGDQGSGGGFANGRTNTASSLSSPYAVTVGGTSPSTFHAAQNDPTLASVVQKALNLDQSTLWQLIAGGLTSRPGDSADADATFVETVWNQYVLKGTDFTQGYLDHWTGAGGVDPTQPTPWYQTQYGLTPTTSDPDDLPGRGTPDVSALAGGNMAWVVPPGDMSPTLSSNGGTSAATPFWAALTAQFNAIFKDQGLPQLGFMNDLLYNASAIKIASFNDITIGNNTSSYVLGGHYTADDQSITPTGYGYSASPGYDLATGLGSPNGILLGRALTEIAHHQTSYAGTPSLLDAAIGGGWQTGDVGQNVLIQATTAANTAVHVVLGSENFDFTSQGASSYAWTARLAQQSLQDDFDPNLVRMFDKAHQGSLFQGDIAKDSAVSIAIGGDPGTAVQAGLTSEYGFANFFAGSGVVDLARAVAVAETAGAANDQNAIVRLRQNGEDTVAVSFYRVDDYSGKIGSLSPGDSAYAAAAQARLYAMKEGSTAVDGAGYGLYTQAQITHVNAGDLIAMQLTNKTSGNVYWAFSQANETVGSESVGHLWSYGANTWGWEDTHGGGDRDFNDLVVQLDFTSASGHGWLV